MKIEYLREFVVLANNLNYSTAAAQLYISQPVLSRHISFLEEEIGAKLFHRNTQSVSLTDAGKYFRKQCEKILKMYDTTCDEIRLREKGFSYNLRIGIPYYSSNSYLGPFPELFKKEYPSVNLIFSAKAPDQCFESLMQDEVDAVLIVDMPYSGSEGWTFHHLYKEPYGILMNVNHRLASQPSVTWDDLCHETFLKIGGPYRKAVQGMIQGLCKKAGFTPKESDHQYDQVESALLTLQNQTEGIIVVGKDMSGLQFRNTTCVPLKEPNSFRWVSLVHKKEESHSGLQLFVKLFQNYVGETGWESKDH